MTGTVGRGKAAWLGRIARQKQWARESGEEISDLEARLREVARMHRPTLTRLIVKDPWRTIFDRRLYDGIEIALTQGIVALPNCLPLEPKAVHARRRYDKIIKEAARMIEESTASPEQVRFMCSEFFVVRRNEEDLLVRFGGRRYPYKITEKKFAENYVDRTVTLDNHSTIRNVKSPRTFSFYLHLYWRMESLRSSDWWQRDAHGYS
jgi:hypothetical protein